MIKLGSKVKDKVTGYEGIAVARTTYLTGCDRYSVQSEKLDKDKKPNEWQLFDEHQLEVLVVEKVTFEAPKAAASRGGPKPTPGRILRGDPRRPR